MIIIASWTLSIMSRTMYDLGILGSCFAIMFLRSMRYLMFSSVLVKKLIAKRNLLVIFDHQKLDETLLFLTLYFYVSITCTEASLKSKLMLRQRLIPVPLSLLCSESWYPPSTLLSNLLHPFARFSWIRPWYISLNSKYYYECNLSSYIKQKCL